eukprot:scaffold47862_cov28-Tisochrysis_lutea.AAC.4
MALRVIEDRVVGRWRLRGQADRKGKDRPHKLEEKHHRRAGDARDQPRVVPLPTALVCVDVVHEPLHVVDEHGWNRDACAGRPDPWEAKEPTHRQEEPDVEHELHHIELREVSDGPSAVVGLYEERELPADDDGAAEVECEGRACCRLSHTHRPRHVQVLDRLHLVDEHCHDEKWEDGEEEKPQAGAGDLGTERGRTGELVVIVVGHRTRLHASCSQHATQAQRGSREI